MHITSTSALRGHLLYHTRLRSWVTPSTDLLGTRLGVSLVLSRCPSQWKVNTVVFGHWWVGFNCGENWGRVVLGYGGGVCACVCSPLEGIWEPSSFDPNRPTPDSPSTDGISSTLLRYNPTWHTVNKGFRGKRLRTKWLLLRKRRTCRIF